MLEVTWSGVQEPEDEGDCAVLEGALGLQELGETFSPACHGAREGAPSEVSLELNFGRGAVSQGRQHSRWWALHKQGREVEPGSPE